MSDRDSIAFTLYLNTWLDEHESISDFSKSTISALYSKWKDEYVPALDEEHRGDCTNIPMTCMRCTVDEFFENAEAIDKVIKEHKHVTKK